MLSHYSHGHGPRPLLLLTLMAGLLHHAHALSQAYCSSQNTGSDYSAVTDIYQSNGACFTECSANYAYAVVQWQQCWCSNYAPADQLDVSECSQNCPGFPAEQCGNANQGLFGYVQLNMQPSGTQGSDSGGSSSPSSTAQSSSTPPPSSDTASPSSQDGSTVISSVAVTVTATAQQSVSVAVSYVTLSPSEEPTTSSTPESTPSSTPSSTTPSSTPPPPSSTETPTTTSTEVAAVVTPSSSTSLSHTTFVSTRVVTLAGAPVTQTVTSTAVVTPGAANTPGKETENKRVSGGTVAGAVIGSIAGVALVLAGAFLLWRRRRADPSDPESSASSRARKMERNTSVLSKTGLLSSPMNNHADGEKDGTMAFGHRRNTSGSTAPNPVSPGDLDRRNSRPLIYDQRLNPAAIMEHWESNGSRASIGTMQDQRDYSRPLGVTNPDPNGDD